MRKYISFNREESSKSCIKYTPHCIILQSYYYLSEQSYGFTQNFALIFDNDARDMKLRTDGYLVYFRTVLFLSYLQKSNQRGIKEDMR